MNRDCIGLILSVLNKNELIHFCTSTTTPSDIMQMKKDEIRNSQNDGYAIGTNKKYPCTYDGEQFCKHNWQINRKMYRKRKAFTLG